MLRILSITECNSGTIQKLLFGVNTTAKLKNVTPTTRNKSTTVS